MEMFRGKKEGTQIYMYDDYLYSIDSRYDNVFRCNTRRTTKCPGSCIVHNNNNVEVVREHNHPKTPFMKEQYEMKEEILQLCRETNMALKNIFDSVCRRNPNAAQYLSFASLRCSMYRERTKSLPSIPDNVLSLYDLIENFDVLQNVYKGKIFTSDGKTAIFLSNDYLLQALSSTTEIFVDGTFSVLPRKPHIAQLYSVHIRYMDTGIATLFVLCDVRTTTLYDALWDTITQLVPQLEANVKFIMSDFESAAIKSLSQKFPTAKLTGCWFHFNQAVLRKWRKLHLSNIPRTVLCMTMALPLLPSNLFQEALNIIQNEADQLSNEYPDILQFMSYLRLNWLPAASKISTYRCPVRTNNIVESFHNTMTQKLGTRSNIWMFLEKLSHLISDQELDLRRLHNGVVPRRPRKRANREFDSKVRHAQQDLVNQRLSVREFLLMFTSNTNLFQMEQTASLEDVNLLNDEHIDTELFSDNLDETDQTSRTNIPRTQRIHRHIRSTNIDMESSDNLNETGRQNTPHTGRIHRYTYNERENVNEIRTSAESDPPHSLEAQSNIDSESIIEIQDEESVYDVPEDDYSYLDENNTRSEDMPFHRVNWNFEDNETSTQDNSILRNCTICLEYERTHAFVPCGHLACCINCIKQLEKNQCPICNVVYTNYVRIRRP